METHKEMKPEEKCYRITLLRFGKAVVSAKSQNDAARKALLLKETDIHWLSDQDGIPGGRLVSLVEPLDESM
ncbi:hypothetical protein GPL15_05310 [Clostridium sp. MCC353]|uniref:hypothetical protein n=1 Tax=Clostridium sp. MCC353 TaxID=2592646 RepID=UPI001C00AB3E|nr:hypothetical protein [Clostridium sp. MCC353]MBT9775921.1 hypothetical protein [Clostridium sp. MCC353]